MEQPWEDRITNKLSKVAAALDFIDQCRKPENIEIAKETGAMRDAAEWLESSARELVEFIRKPNVD